MSTWTKDKPLTGEWWVSIAPERRPAFHGADFPAVRKCLVDAISPGHLWVVDGIEPTLHVRYNAGGDWIPLEQDWFKGAQWKRVDPDPADPFTEQPRDNSRDSDLP